MVYLDYSATTPCDERVLKRFVESSRHHIANPNSGHPLGVVAHTLLAETAQSIARDLACPESEVVFTSGATEANNLAIRGLKRPQNAHAITTVFEHPSVTACFTELQKTGVQVEFAKTDANGVIDIDALERQITPSTYLVSIGAVNSEIGLVQDLGAIKRLLSLHPHITFHADITQALGKMPLSAPLPDLVSFSAHKIHGLKGVGALIKPQALELQRVLVGGNSFNASRPGTPSLPLAVSLAEAVRLATKELEDRREKVIGLYRYLRAKLAGVPGIHINSNDHCLPQIVNLSVAKLPSTAIRDALGEQGIYVSTQTACASDIGFSQAVFRFTGSEDLAKSAIRISLSHLSTAREIDALCTALERLVQG